MSAAVRTAHLDLGCGPVPRNPYARDTLYGVDLVAAGEYIRAANLAVAPIPFADNQFDSVSAYDFLEHVPRVLPSADGSGTRLPFVELMNEVWRVLKPGGLFYASTPVYPHVNAFADPTHVNTLTVGTHVYFTRPALLAAPYGFVGDFQARRVQLASPNASTLYTAPVQGLWNRLRHAWRVRRGRCGHLVWEFEAHKPAPP
jgi:SAM-dependent methyltransferase